MSKVWGVMKKCLPCRARRRTWCFCNCSCQNLENILKGIHNRQCEWTPQRPDVLDETTEQYITSILRSCKDSFHVENTHFRLVGSSAEGLGKPYTLELNKGYNDPLVKFLLRFFCCCCPCSTAYTSLRTDFDIIMECSSSYNNIKNLFQLEEKTNAPGFVRLAALWTPEGSGLSFFCKNVDGHDYLSSNAVRGKILEIVNESSENLLPASRIFGYFKHPIVIELEETGPAVKLLTYPLGQAWYWNDDQRVVAFEGDVVFGIHYLQKWPGCALRWMSRPRMWPPAGVVKEVAESGFILVPKPSNEGSAKDDEVEWHISFPHCETYISTKIPKVAKACFLALKLILKNHLVYHCESLKTYHLKTVMLWELEKHPEEFWQLENIVECFECLFDSLVECVNQRKCLNYWVESLNLFEKIDSRELSSLTGVLKKIQAKPAPYIDDIGSMWC